MPNIVIFGITATCDISKFSQLYHNFEITLGLFMPNITTNHAITYTYTVVSGKLLMKEECSATLLVYLAFFWKFYLFIMRHFQSKRKFPFTGFPY